MGRDAERNMFAGSGRVPREVDRIPGAPGSGGACPAPGEGAPGSRRRKCPEPANGSGLEAVADLVGNGMQS